MAYEYDPKDIGSERFLILNRPGSDFPTEPMKIVKVEERKTNDGRTTFPCLILEEMKTGTRYAMPAWAREIEPIISQYGVKTETWEGQYVRFKLNSTNTRWVIQPATDINPPEEKVK